MRRRLGRGRAGDLVHHRLQLGPDRVPRLEADHHLAVQVTDQVGLDDMRTDLLEVHAPGGCRGAPMRTVHDARLQRLVQLATGDRDGGRPDLLEHEARSTGRAHRPAREVIHRHQRTVRPEGQARVGHRPDLVDALRGIGFADHVDGTHLEVEDVHLLVALPGADMAVQVAGRGDAPDPVGGIDEGAFQQAAAHRVQHLAGGDDGAGGVGLDGQFAAGGLGDAVAIPHEDLVVIPVARGPVGLHPPGRRALRDRGGCRKGHAGGGPGGGGQETAARDALGRVSHGLSFSLGGSSSSGLSGPREGR